MVDSMWQDDADPQLQTVSGAAPDQDEGGGDVRPAWTPPCPSVGLKHVSRVFESCLTQKQVESLAKCGLLSYQGRASKGRKGLQKRGGPRLCAYFGGS